MELKALGLFYCIIIVESYLALVGGGLIFQIIFNNLTNRVTLILIIAFFLSHVGMIKKVFLKKDLEYGDIVFLSLIFGSMGILGTYTGIEVNGAIANARVIGVFVGGLIGGPKVGLLSGLIAGGHRYLIDIGGFTALSCSLSTILEGLLGGFLSRKFSDSNIKVRFAFVWGMAAEIMQMAIILLIARPYSQALELVELIAIPMVMANAFGIAVFISIAESISREVENEAAYQAQLSLQIADESLKYFRRGYNRESAQAIAHIIKDYINIDAVAFTDRKKILAHVGAGHDHHIYEKSLQTKITRDVIDRGSYKICHTKEEISCSDPNCPLKSAVIVALMDRDQVVGSLKLYRTRENGISKMETELALGLARLFSTQIELSKIDIQKELVTQSELKALQAQINPHFLFNAINTISSLIRIDPESARKVLLHLGKYFRNNLNSSMEDVSILREIENVDSYVQIEKARFGDKLNVIYHIGEGVECSLPALIIQPIVENAIKHGIFNKLEGGTVEIKVEEEAQGTKIQVRDNGIGMDFETLDRILGKQAGENKIGIRNVNERLKNKYGDRFGLRINSEIGVGTNVEFIIPR